SATFEYGGLTPLFTASLTACQGLFERFATFECGGFTPLFTASLTACQRLFERFATFECGGLTPLFTAGLTACPRLKFGTRVFTKVVPITPMCACSAVKPAG